MTLNTTLTLGGVWIACALSSCSRVPAADVDAERARPDQVTHRMPQMPDYEARELHLALGADLNRCNVDAPRFFYDGTEVTPQDVADVQALARCLTRPWMADRNVRLVGHADSRGSGEYHDELAQERAESVKSMLVEQGVTAERIEVVSHGETDARGHQAQYSHGDDRRVEIVELFVVAP